MKVSDELKAIEVLMDGLIRDMKAWEAENCKIGYGEYFGRVGATRTGIQERIKVIRAMLLQISKDVEK